MFTLADRVQETCAAPGTGIVTLLGAVTEYQSFSAGIGANNTTYYTIADQTGSNWEVGLGTIGATGLTLTRTTILASSNAGSVVNFSVGIQNIWCDYPAGKAVYGTGTTLVAPSGTILPVLNGGSGVTTSTGSGSVVLSAAPSLTGAVTIGTTSDTGTITVGQSTVSQTINISNGATASGSTKTVNIGTGGLTGSTTTMAIGSTFSTTVAANGTWSFSTPLVATNMVQATTSTSGYLTSTDWTTFNNKSNTNGTVTSVAALTIGTTGTDLSSTVATGTTTPVITLQVPTASATNRGALSSADWTTFNNKGSGTVTSVTGTAPVVSSGGTTPAISMAAATTSVSGYLTSTDWNTFNGKAPSVTYTTTYIPFGQGTTTPNLSANFTYTTGTGLLAAPIIQASNGLILNSKTIGTSYTIPTADNAMSVGPITISSGVTITLPSGSRWVVL